MKIEPLPSFTDAALQLWSAIVPTRRKLLLSNVWCSNCQHEVTIKAFSGVVKSGDLLLVGKCAECHSDVARLIESS